MTAPVLIVNADDFGLSRGINKGIVEAHLRGIVTSTSLMVRQPAAMEAAALAQTHPDLDVGLHLDIGEWRRDGDDWTTVYERAPGADPVALKREVDEQVALFRELMHALPSHIDSHQHAHLREPLRSIVIDTATRLSVPIRHFTPAVRYRGEFFGRGENGESLAERLEPSWLAAFISMLESGVSELCCHPASSVDFESDYGEERVRELHALCSPHVVAAVHDRGVSMLTFRALARVPVRTMPE